MQQKPRHQSQLKTMDEAWAALGRWAKTAGRKYELTNRPVNRVVLSDGTRQVMAEDEEKPDYPHENLIFDAIAIWGGNGGALNLGVRRGEHRFIAYVKDAPKDALAGSEHPGMSLRWWGKDLKVMVTAADEDEARKRVSTLFLERTRLTIQIVQTA